MSYSNPMHHADGAVAPVRTVDLLRDELIDLRAALQAVLALDIRGHQLQDRLQFSDAGRALLAQCRDALRQ